MKDQYTSPIDELLPRYCQGTATDEERRAIEAWINASPENKKVAEQVATIYLATDTITVLNHIDTEKALKKITGRMIVSRRRSRWEWVQRIAAVLFLPLLAAFVVQQYRDVKPPEQLAQTIELKTNPGMTTSVLLPDSTVVHLNSESSLSYPSHFEGDIRQVHLRGEAYFEVARHPGKRFVVSTIHQLQVEVLGTRFNIDAYEENEEVVTTLVEGSVNFLFRRNNRQRTIALQPGQKVMYNPRAEEIRLHTTSGESETSWKDGKIVLRDTPLREALRMLEKRYHVQFHIKSQKGLDDTFTGVFTNERIDRILDHFRISSKIRWRYLPDTDKEEKKTQIEIY